MSDTYINPGSAAALLPEVFAAEAVPYLYNKSQLLRFVSNVTGINPAAGAGDTVNVPLAAAVSVGSLATTGNSEITLTAPDDDVAAITVDQFAYGAFVIRDDVSKQAIPTYAAMQVRTALDSIVDHIETAIATLFSSATNSVETTGNCNVALLTSAHTTLSTNKVPLDGRCTALHPLAWGGLCADSLYTSRDYNPAMPLAYGNAGQVLGTALVQTAATPTTTGTTVGAMFEKNAIAIAIQIMPELVSQYDVMKQGTVYVARALYGLALVSQDRICKITSAPGVSS